MGVLDWLARDKKDGEKTGKIKGNREKMGEENQGKQETMLSRIGGRGSVAGLAVMDMKAGYSFPPCSDPCCLSLPHPRRISWCFNLNGFHSCQLSVIHHKKK